MRLQWSVLRLLPIVPSVVSTLHTVRSLHVLQMQDCAQRSTQCMLFRLNEGGRVMGEQELLLHGR
jgi:hypothetical protein